jgi:hypothetical protein
MSLIILFLTSIKTEVNKKVWIGILCLMFILGNYNHIQYAFTNRWKFTDISLSGFQEVKKNKVEIKKTLSGLSVYVPVEGEQCWDSPIPCTPYFNPTLKLREPNDIKFGFLVTEYEDLHWATDNE